MIQIIAGEKGEGKTKRLIELANLAGKESNGHVVFIDDDNRHMYDLHHNIRFVKVNYEMDDIKILLGFIYGVISQDSDIEHILIDGIKNIVSGIDSKQLDCFIKEIEKISVNESVDFSVVINETADKLPTSVEKYLA